MALLCLHLLCPPHPPLAAVSSPWRRALPATRPAARPASRLLYSNRHTAPSSASLSIVGVLLDYLNESWTQFHTSIEGKRQLLAAGFELLSENDDWNLQLGGRYFFTRNMSCLVAFAVGENCTRRLMKPTIARPMDEPYVDVWRGIAPEGDCPVIKGNKWSSTKWLHVGEYKS
ncbi:putative aspartyl aminopeptidase [Hordeum vulgare]|nr:putative aspartyl aminopeptidase [Hordeum vulgare]